MNRPLRISLTLALGITLMLLMTFAIVGCGSQATRAGQDPNPPAIDDLRPGASLDDANTGREAALPSRNPAGSSARTALNAGAGQTGEQLASNEAPGREVTGSIIRVTVPLDHPLGRAWQLTEASQLPDYSVADWRDNGFVVAELPLSKLAAFEAALGSIQSISRTRLIGMQRLGTIRVGPDYKKPVPFEFTPPGGSPRRTTLPAGVPQMLVRAEMLDRDRATIEIKPHQYYERLTVAPRAPREKALDGTIFNTLTLLTVAPSDRILVIGPVDQAPQLIPDRNAQPPAEQPTDEGPVDVSDEALTTLFENMAATAPPDTQLGHLFLHQRFRGRPTKSIIFVVIDMPRPKVPANIAVSAQPEPQPAQPAQPAEIPARAADVAATELPQPQPVAPEVERITPEPVTPRPQPRVIEVTASDISRDQPTAPQPVEAIEAVEVREAASPPSVESLPVEQPRPAPTVITIDAEAVVTPAPAQAAPMLMPEPVASTSESRGVTPVEMRALPQPIDAEPEPFDAVKPAPTVIEVEAEHVPTPSPAPKPAPAPVEASVLPVSVERIASDPNDQPQPRAETKPAPQPVRPAPVVIEAEAVEVVDEPVGVEEVQPAEPDHAASSDADADK